MELFLKRRTYTWLFLVQKDRLLNTIHLILTDNCLFLFDNPFKNDKTEHS